MITRVSKNATKYNVSIFVIFSVLITIVSIFTFYIFNNKYSLLGFVLIFVDFVTLLRKIIKFRTFETIVFPDLVIIQYGNLFKVRKTIFRSKIISVEIKENFIQRKFNIHSIQLNTNDSAFDISDIDTSNKSLINELYEKNK